MTQPPYSGDPFHGGPDWNGNQDPYRQQLPDPYGTYGQNPGSGHHDPRYQHQHSQYPGYGSQRSPYPQGPGYSGYGQPHWDGMAHQPGSGKIDVLSAVQWAGSATMRSGGVMFGASAVFFVAYFVLTMIVTAIGTSLVVNGQEAAFNVLLILFAIVAVIGGTWFGVSYGHTAMQALNKPKVTWADLAGPNNVLPIIGVVILLNLFAWAVAAVPLFLLFPLTGNSTMPGEVMVWPALAVAILLMLISPLTVLAIFATFDGEGVVESLRRSISIGSANYGKLLLFMIVAMIVIPVASGFTLGLALIFLSPIYLVALGHMYRQGSGGLVPVGP